MMRAVRFAARLDFRMDWGCRRAIRRHYADILHASTPRLQEEIMRLFGHGCAATAFRLLWEYRLMSVLLPELHDYVERTGGSRSPLWRHLAAFDQDPLNAEASNGLRIAVLFAPIYRTRVDALFGNHASFNGQVVAQEVLDPLVTRMQLPRQTYYTACALLDAQRRFEEGARRAKRGRMVRHDLFKEALALRRIVLTAAEQDLASLREWEALAMQEPSQKHPHMRPTQEQSAGSDNQPEESGSKSPAPSDQDAAPRGTAHRRRRPGRRRHSAAAPGETGSTACADAGATRSTPSAEPRDDLTADAG